MMRTFSALRDGFLLATTLIASFGSSGRHALQADDTGIAPITC